MDLPHLAPANACFQWLKKQVCMLLESQNVIKSLKNQALFTFASGECILRGKQAVFKPFEHAFFEPSALVLSPSARVSAAPPSTLRAEGSSLLGCVRVHMLACQVI